MKKLISDATKWTCTEDAMEYGKNNPNISNDVYETLIKQYHDQALNEKMTLEKRMKFAFRSQLVREAYSGKLGYIVTYDPVEEKFFIHEKSTKHIKENYYEN